ncbi:hypothetical protein [uncultured Jannaschia sp.]|uniref:hypothetical protein n=1 Tax=uncultured Jannaschia sp. TaxID=293347 RepID=UPI0026367EB7|nr:hypothetical protein [uncultured Jannaschia sp.]
MLTGVPLTVEAQGSNDLERGLNSSELCAALPELDALQVADLLGISVDIPRFFPIDLTARWDKNRHEVRRFTTEGANFTAELVIGCQPSDQSAVIKALPISAENVRLFDNVRCEGVLPGEGSTASADCEVSGEIGSFIARFIDLNGYVARFVQSN